MTDVTISRGIEPGAIGKVTELHGLYYARHWGFGPDFEADIAEELAELTRRYDPRRDCFLLAKTGGTILGSITIQSLPDNEDAAKLRWFILDEAAHGKGAGGALIAAAMAFVDASGYRTVDLDTFEGLTAACRLYEKHGFALTRRTPDDTVYGPPVTGLHYVWTAPSENGSMAR